MSKELAIVAFIEVVDKSAALGALLESDAEEGRSASADFDEERFI